MKYRIAQLLRRAADRIDRGLHRAFMDAERAADIYDALNKAEDERRRIRIQHFPADPQVTTEELARIIRQRGRQELA